MSEVTELNVVDQVETSRPKLVIRIGRGRTGGSTALDLIIQRARHQGRRVKPLDGDLKSRTLMNLYPAEVDGQPVEDAATAPPSDDLPEVRDWLSDELNQMVEDGVSRVLDLSGGDRVMQEYVRELHLTNFCRDFGVDVVLMAFIGPEQEDFRHVYQLLKTAGIPADKVVVVFNEGVIRAGQTVDGAFSQIVKSQEFKEVAGLSARMMFMRRLTCMSQLHDRGLRFYDTIAVKPSALSRGKVTATLYHMVKTWIDNFEQELISSGVVEWMP